MAEIRCVAFDLDGVVISSTASFDYFETQHGITRADFMAFFSGSYRRAMRGEVDLFEVLPDALAAWGWSARTEEFAKIWMESCADCDPAVCEIILALPPAGIECCLARCSSSMTSRRTWIPRGAVGGKRRCVPVPTAS